MPLPHALDHLFVVVLVVLYPLNAWWGTLQLKRRAAAGELEDYSPLSDYRGTIATQWILCSVFMAGWLAAGRPVTDLGLRVGAPTGSGMAIGAVLALAGLIPVYLLMRQVQRRPDLRQTFSESYGDLTFLMPSTPRELRAFDGVALTAGICEEVLYRGFLIAYFAAFWGLWPAVFAASGAFGVAHLYQGPAKALQVVVIGLWMALLYVATGSLWLSMFVHFVFDALMGRVLMAIRVDSRPVGAGARAEAS